MKIMLKTFDQQRWNRTQEWENNFQSRTYDR